MFLLNKDFKSKLNVCTCKSIEYDGVRGLINSLITVLVLLFVQCKLYPGALLKVYVLGKIHSLV